MGSGSDVFELGKASSILSSAYSIKVIFQLSSDYETDFLKKGVFIQLQIYTAAVGSSLDVYWGSLALALFLNFKHPIKNI